MEKLTELLKQLADKLGVTVEHLWGVLVYQGRIEAIKSIILLFCSSVAVYIYYRLYKKYEVDEDSFSIGWVLASVFVFAALLSTIVNIVTAIDGLLNPEYWALNKILRKLK